MYQKQKQYINVFSLSATSLKLIGVVEGFESFQYSFSFVDVGSFKIKCAASKKNISLLQINNIITNTQKKPFVPLESFAGVITTVEITMEDNNLMMEVTGTDLKGLLQRRIETRNISWFDIDASLLVSNIISHAILADSGEKRQIFANPTWKFIENEGYKFPTITRMSQYGEVVEEEINQICRDCNIGYHITLNGKNLEILILTSLDNNSTIIGKEFNNINEETYTNSNADSVTTIYCINENIADRFIIGDQFTGINRKEELLDSSLGLEATDENGNQITLTIAQLTENIKTEAREKITEDINCIDVNIINEDLSIGQIVKIIDAEVGYSQKLRIDTKEITLQKGTVTTNYIIGTDIRR